MKTGIILASISVILYTVWNLFYILCLYKNKEVYEGTGDTDDPDNYKKISKKNYFLREVIFNLFVFGFLNYSYVACNTW